MLQGVFRVWVGVGDCYLAMCGISEHGIVGRFVGGIEG